MDLRQIKYFLTVAEERNITRAAERLHLSQPPLSRALMELEEELGCTLLIRGKRHVTLTPEGLALKRRGEELLALADITKSEISDVRKGLSGTLYLGHVDSNGPTLVAEWISSFKKEYPNVTYNLWCGTVDDLTYRMKSGLLELAITMTPLNTEHLDAENAGCALNRRGFITTDYYLQSSPNSWAIGDVNGKMLFAHAATHQGEYVARTILGLEFSPYQAGPCPYCLHGSMEIMHVGLTEREAAALGGEILVSKSLFSSNVISQARGDASGFVKVVWRNGEMAGIAAIGGCATQLTLSAELLLMGQYSGSRLNSFMVAHPTLDETLVDAVKAPRRPSEY